MLFHQVHLRYELARSTQNREMRTMYWLFTVAYDSVASGDGIRTLAFIFLMLKLWICLYVIFK